MFKFPAGRRLPVLLTVVGLVAACATGTGSSPSLSVSQSPTPSIASSPLPSTGPTTPPAPTAAPTAPPEVGLAWSLVDDPDVASYPDMGMMHGVVAGGPGAIAWGEMWGPPGANGGRPSLGPKIWTTSDGRDWVPASVEAPSGAHAANRGAVIDVAAGGPGYVAVGSYYRIGTGMTAVVWTSTDGRTWQLNPGDPALERSLVQQVLSWQGQLLAVGCELITAIDCGDTRIWTSSDGVTWGKVEVGLRPGLTLLWVDDSPDRLWALGLNPDEGMMLASTRPPLLTSMDGGTWETSSLPMLGYGRLHPLPDGLYLTLAEVPPDDPSSVPHPAWISRTPGVYRSTDLKTWEPQAVGRQLGEEIVAAGDTLVMLGTTGTDCWLPGRCAAAAWRSTDEGQTWQAVPVTGSTPNDRPGGTMRATAALTDGTLVAVGDLMGTDGIGVTATWVSPPQPGS
jgi:hypothetical protein